MGSAGDAASVALRLDLNRNAAFACIKLGRGDDALRHADAALAEHPGDAKARYRQVQAHELLQDIRTAAVRCAELVKIDPANKEAQDTMRRLREKLAEESSKRETTQGICESASRDGVFVFSPFIF